MRRAVYVAAGTAAGVLAAGGALTTIGPWYLGLRKPSWQPPGWAFAPAWTLIGGLSAWSGMLAWEGARDVPERRETVLLFGANAACNVLWSALFFKLRRPDWALGEVVLLWLSIALPIIRLRHWSPRAAALLLPYLLWVSFAAYLNLTIVRLNAPFTRVEGRA